MYEPPTKVNTGLKLQIDKIDLSKKGIFTVFKNAPYPYPGFTDPEVFPRLDVVKRALVMVFRLAGIKILLFKKARKSFFDDFSILTNRAFKSPLKSYWLLPERYCRSGRELYRVLSKYVENEEIVKSICIFWEFDNAYRFRGQDFMGLYKRIGLLDAIDELKNREVPRFENDIENDMIKKWKMAKRAVIAIKWLKPKLYRVIIKILDELDLDEMELKNSDKWYAYFKKGYNFNSLDYKTRMEARKDL